MPDASILIKPASSACNLRCRYCFYRTLSDSRAEGERAVMTLETLETLVKNALEYADTFCAFAFQGGEPALAGLAFYRELLALQRKYNRKGVTVQNTIQTNGTLFDAEWAAFLAENHFLVGLSLDGPRRENSFRVDSRGEPALPAILDAAALLDRHHVEYNIVSVVNARSVQSPEKIYRYFKNKGFRYLQFIPCLDGAPGGGCSITPEQYGAFLNRLFDLWYEDYMGGFPMDIRMFSNWVQMAAGYRPEECGMSGCCSCYFVVESDGQVYPCDFYAADEWLLGSVGEGFHALAAKETARRFVETSRPVHPKCRACRWLALCRGGCRRWREPFADGQPGLNSLCEAYALFFEHCGERVVRLGRALRLSRRPAVRLEGRRLGPNNERK